MSFQGNGLFGRMMACLAHRALHASMTAMIVCQLTVVQFKTMGEVFDRKEANGESVWVSMKLVVTERRL
jgi:hypothetical protein